MKTSWGLRIAGSFAAAPLALGACGGPQPAEPPRPLPPSTASAPASSSAPAPPPPPAPPSPKLGAFSAVSDGSGQAIPIPSTRHFARSSTFMLVSASVSPTYGTNACPITTPSCTMMAVAKFQAPQTLADRLAEVDPPGGVNFGPITPSEISLFDLSDGQDAVYAASLKERKLAIYKVGADAKATLFVEDTQELGWQRAQVIETVSGHVIFGTVSTDGPEELVAAEVEDRGGKRQLGPLVKLGYGMVPNFRQSAQGARYPESEGLNPVWALHATSLLDASGGLDKSWALALVQVNPPPFTWKAGRPYKKPAQRGAKHGCGGPGSRPLADKSVEKLVKVLRFDGAKIVSEHIVDRPQTRDLFAEAFEAHAAPDGALTVDGVVWNRDGKQSGTKGKFKRGPLPGILESVEMVNPGWFRTASFDAASKEGLLAWIGGKGYARRFDEEGKPKGEVETVDDPNSGTVHRVGGEWLSMSNNSLMWLTGPHRGTSTTWNYKEGTARAVTLTGDKLSVFTSLGTGCATMAFEPATLTQSGKPEPVPACDGKYAVSAPLTLASGKVGIVRISDRGRLVEVVPLDGEPVALADETMPPGKFLTSTLYPVWNDLVVVRSGSEGLTATWVRAQKTITGIPPLAAPTPSAPKQRVQGGPVLGDGERVLPDEPGMPVHAPELLEAAKRGCSGYSVVGPRRGALSCVEAIHATKPALVPGVRLFGY